MQNKLQISLQEEITNRISLLNKCCDIPGLGDHQSAILADIECHPKKQKPISRKIYLRKKANHELPRETIQQNVESFIATNDIRTPVNTLWEKFSFFVSNTQDKYVPRKMPSVRYCQSWFTSHCKKLVRKKKSFTKEQEKVNLVQIGTNIYLQQLYPEKHAAMPIMSLSKTVFMRTIISIQSVFTHTLKTNKLIIFVQDLSKTMAKFTLKAKIKLEF